jgi:hypothetical protein
MARGFLVKCYCELTSNKGVTMPKTPKQKQRDYYKRKTERGYANKTYWVKTDKVPQVTQFVKKVNDDG